jgi:DNA-binding MarR family transcriptional regulator
MTESYASRAHAAMSHLVLEQRDLRQLTAERTGVSFARARVLRRLARGPMRMSELAEELGTEKPYLTVMIDDLEQRGLVTRTQSSDDRRVRVLALTDAGRTVAEQAEQVVSEPAPGLSRLTPGELATLVSLLEKAAAPQPG